MCNKIITVKFINKLDIKAPLSGTDKYFVYFFLNGF